MVSDWISRIDSLIKWSFYALFFFVPLVMWPDTYELFEFNKMWLVFGITIFVFFLWASKMVLQGKFAIRKTPLDIPIALFLLSQIISTFFSIDPHVSLWGYYSRFNGGLFSIGSYIFLYYAFTTNLILIHTGRDNEAQTYNPISYKLLATSLLSGLIVTLWGIPSHFGYDPTCLLFRGKLDVSCWTESFQPTIRIFSTLGQPNWMGTFLAILIPISLGFGLFKLNENRKRLFTISCLLLAVLFYVALLWTRSQSSFLGLVLGMILLFGIIALHEIKKTSLSFKDLTKERTLGFIAVTIIFFVLATFFIGSPIPSFNKRFTLEAVKNSLTKKQALQKEASQNQASEGFSANPNIELGGTESSKIRLIVWKGAIEIFKQNPFFGTGVETFAYAYYKVKPLEHNLTSEWDYLYNKAHNEYLNYLATTGGIGLATYLLMIAFFIFLFIRSLSKRSENFFISSALGASYVAILVSNFFGFSVVIVNLFLFFIPAFFFELENAYSNQFRSFTIKNEGGKYDKVSIGKLSLIAIIGIISLYYQFYLLNFWLADRRYALGYNFDKVSELTQAYTPLNEAVKMLPGEDLYKDELSVNMATLAVLLAQQNQSSQASQLANEARKLSDEVTSRHPRNVVFYKTRTRVAFALSQLDPKFIDLAIDSIEKASALAPTDAKLAYNKALFYNQKGDGKKTLELLEKASQLKPNYIDAYYAMALLYSQAAKDDLSKASEYKARAREKLEYVLKNIDPNHSSSKELLKSL